MLIGARVHVNPDGDTVEASATVPVKLLTGATVIVDVPAAPARRLALVGLAVTEKSDGALTVTFTLAE